MGKIKLDDLPERYRQQAEAQIADRVARSVANLEQDTCDGAMAEEKTEGLDPLFSGQVRIHIHSIRKRLCDADGISGKAAIDGLVHAGVLHGDDPAHVQEVTYSQEKAEGREEETIISIEEI